MTDQRSDQALLADHLEGDPQAFEVLLRRHRDRLWAVALRTTGNPDEAADALQDAMVSVLRNASAYRGDAAVTTWMHRIVVNACLDRMRRAKVRRTVPLPGHDDDRGGDLPDSGDAIGDKELQVVLDSALRSLPEEQRVPIVLVDVEGYPVNDVAAMLGIPVGTVKSRCARGRAKLAANLSWLRSGNGGNPASASSVLPGTTETEGGAAG